MKSINNPDIGRWDHEPKRSEPRGSLGFRFTPRQNKTQTTIAWSCLAVITAVCAAGSFHLQGGQLAIDWFSISGGAGSSSGGTFAVSGTAGQPALAQASGGAFTLDGGFWTLSTSSSNQPPQLVAPQILGNAFSFGFQTINGQRYMVQTNGNLLNGVWGAYTNLTGDGTVWQITFPLTDGVPRLFFRVAMNP